MKVSSEKPGIDRERLYLFGCGGHARSLINTIKKNTGQQIKQIILVDDACHEDEVILGCITVKKKDFLDNNKDPFLFILANGDIKARKEEFEALIGIGGVPFSIIADTANIGIDVNIGEGTFIAENTYLGPEVSIGDNCIINTGAVIEHESGIGDNTHIAPGSVICGRSRIGDNTFIGAKAVVRDKIEVGSDIVIGAGSVVIRSISEPGTYAGNPARGVEKHEQ